MTGDERGRAEDSADVRAFYDALGSGEWERLDRDAYHRLEWAGTVEYLRRHLPAAPDGESGPDADDGSGSDRPHVLDVGGGAGRYAVWLAERGYDVTLADPSREQSRIARGTVAERGLDDRVGVARGDVRDLPVGADAFDATLCLGGPLSHVLDADERERAVSELSRVTRPGSPVLVSVLGRLAMVQATVQAAGSDHDAAAPVTHLPEFVRTGDYDRDLLERAGVDPGPAPFTAHCFRVAELEGLLEAGGLTVETVAGLEGIASARRVADADLEDVDADAREAVRETIGLLREDRTVADLSTHVLAVARVGE
jgi:SAM-dependent methyltransferase